MLDLIDFDKCSEKEKQYLLEQVKKNGLVIKGIYNPSLEMQLEAVKQNRWAILYINNPSEAVWLEVIKEDGSAINFIRKNKLTLLEKIKYFCKTE